MDLITSAVLPPLSNLISTASMPLHPVYYPFPLASTLHAARISCAYRSRTKALGQDQAMKKKGWLVNVAGFLVMAWGGSFLTSFLLSAPPPQLLSPLPLINYLSVHLILSLIFPVSSIPPPHFLDPLIFLLDALMRTFPISGAVLSTANHPNEAIRSSLMFPLVLGGLSTSGGGLIASTLNVFGPEWKFSTPPILFAGWPAYFDFVAGAIGAATYIATSHPIVANLLGAVKSETGIAAVSVLSARSLVCLVLCVLYAGRALTLYGSPFVQAVPQSQPQKAVANEKKKK